MSRARDHRARGRHPMRRLTRRPMRVALLALLAAGALARPARLDAQASTAEMLERARVLYQDLQVERALALLRQVVSPSSPFEVARAQRVQAYTYLGASLAILGQRDSALVYFRAALERDPFVDLDPTIFTPAERDVFAEARRGTFAVGLRPVRGERIDPAREAFTFTVVATHRAELRVALRASDDLAPIPLLETEGEGVQDVRWAGLGPDGRLAPPGRYALVVSGVSRLAPRADSAVVFFDLRHDRPALEDTLPALRPEELLPERYGRAASGRDLLQGLGIASAALLLGRVVGRPSLGEGHRVFAYSIAGAASIAGIASSIRRQRHPEIGDNIVENRRRREARERVNAEIEARNAARLAETKLVITPAAGIGP